MAAATIPAFTGNATSQDGMIPLASPMRWDPHAGQISFASLAALESPAPTIHPGPATEPLFLGLDLSTQVR